MAGWGLFEDGGTQAKKVNETIKIDISLISNLFSAEQGRSGAAVYAVLQE